MQHLQHAESINSYLLSEPVGDVQIMKCKWDWSDYEPVQFKHWYLVIVICN